MIEAFANHLGSHIGRHLFYWATTVPTYSSSSSSSSATDTARSNALENESDYSINLRIANFINKFHGPLERGVQILDHLLTLEEEDFNDHWGSAYIHNYEPEIVERLHEHNSHNNVEDGRVDGNQEVLYPNDVINHRVEHVQQNLIRGNSKCT